MISRDTSGVVYQNRPLTVTISQDKSLWYFGGPTAPSDFTLGSTSATLTANGASTGSFQWTITSGSSKVTLENSSATITKTTATVGISSTWFSTAANDVTIQLQYTPTGGSAVTYTWNLQVDSPYMVVENGSPNYSDFGATSDCYNDTSGTNGYRSVINYKIDSFFGVLISHTNLNESFGTSRNDFYSGNNWGNPTPRSYETPNGNFADNVCSYQVTGKTPSPSPPPSPLGSTLVFDLDQNFYAGSLTTGSGLQVQTDRITYYLDHGRDLSITSPVR